MSTPFAADYPFLGVLGTMIVFFAWVVWIFMMSLLLIDVFRRRDIGGFGKAAWCLFMIVLPFIGALAYVVAQHDGIARRGAEEIERKERHREVAPNPVHARAQAAASAIEDGERLRDRGVISDAEFDALKAKALAAH